MTEKEFEERRDLKVFATMRRFHPSHIAPAKVFKRGWAVKRCPKCKSFQVCTFLKPSLGKVCWDKKYGKFYRYPVKCGECGYMGGPGEFNFVIDC